MATNNLKLGDKVTFTHSLHRLSGGEHRSWGNEELKKPLEGYIVGKRTLQNGAWGWRDDVKFYGEYDGAEYTWQPTDKITYLTAYLIAYNLNRKPVPVLPENITKIYDTTIQTHHFDPTQPDVDTIHTFGSADNGVTWDLVKSERTEQLLKLFDGVNQSSDMSKVLSQYVLEELTRDGQDTGEYD